MDSGTPSPDRELLDELMALARTSDHDDLVRRAEDDWKTARRWESAYDAESCRQTMLAYFALARGGTARDAGTCYLRGWVWRARAMALAAAVGWSDGVMAIAQTEAFRLLAFVNREGAHPSDGDYQVPKEAFQVVDDLRLYLETRRDDADAGLAIEGAPSADWLGRMHYEKRGFLALASDDPRAAVDAYENARRFVERDPRGRYKVKGARALALFVMGMEDEARRETEEVARDAREAGHVELADTADENVEFMKGNRPRFTPYDKL